MTVIAFTRPERRLRESISAAEAAGFVVMAAPSLEIIPRDIRDTERLLKTIRPDDIIIFTSVTAAEECGRSPFFKDSVADSKIISIGPGTSEALKRFGVSADIVPPVYSSEGIVEHMRGMSAVKRVVLIRSDHGSPALDQGLREMGAEVVDFTAYSLKPADPKHLDAILDAGKQGKIDVFAFTSPLSARSFIEAAENKGMDAGDMFNKKIVAAIGGPTSDMLASFGVRVDVMPEKATFDNMLSEIKKKIEMKN